MMLCMFGLGICRSHSVANVEQLEVPSFDKFE